MPSKSKAQQKFFGIVRSIQKGEAPKSKFSKSAQDAAKDMKKSDVKKYAKTKHKGLPNKVKQETKVQSLIKKMVREELEQLNEKCWKGYEKKGMKTMFGKRYPNCVKKEEKLDELTSFNVVKDRLVDLGFGNLVVSWRGTKKKVKDLNPDARLDYIMIEKTNNTLLKNKSMRYDGNDYKVTPQGKKYFKGTLQLEGKLTEGISVADERHVGKFLIVILSSGSEMRSAILNKKKNADKYNRNDKKDLKTLWDLAGKYKGKEIKEGKLTEAIQPSKAITKVLDMADGGYGKLGGKIVDGLSANLFKTVYDKANDTNKEKMNKMNEKQLYVFLTKLWSKFGRQVKI